MNATKKVFVTGLVVGLVVGVTGVWALQEGMQLPAQAQKDKFLDRLVGEWEWTGTMFHQGQEMEFTSVETHEWILGEHFLSTHHKKTLKDTDLTFEWMTITAAYPDKSEYKNWFFDGMGLTMFNEGKRDGNALNYEGESMGMKSRSKLTISEDGTATSLTEGVWPGSDEWKPFMKMEGKKKSG